MGGRRLTPIVDAVKDYDTREFIATAFSGAQATLGSGPLHPGEQPVHCFAGV